MVSKEGTMEGANGDQAGNEAERTRQEQEDFLDEALEETFPASDPIAPGSNRHAQFSPSADRPQVL